MEQTRVHTMIDAQTDNEHALDHLSAAVNWPTLHNAKRITIGTPFKQTNAS